MVYNYNLLSRATTPTGVYIIHNNIVAYRYSVLVYQEHLLYTGLLLASQLSISLLNQPCL